MFPQAICTPFPLSLSGIANNDLTSDAFTTLTIPLPTIDGNETHMSGEFHILPTLSSGLLVGTDILMANEAIIDFPRQRTRLHGSHWISTHCLRKKKQLSLKKRAIYAAEARIVEPGCGVSLPVRFRQWDSDICHTIPVPQHDLEVGMLGSIPAALISPIR